MNRIVTDVTFVSWLFIGITLFQHNPKAFHWNGHVSYNWICILLLELTFHSHARQNPDAKRLLLGDSGVLSLGLAKINLTIRKHNFEIICAVFVNHDLTTGGEDFDHRVMDYFMKLFKHKTGQDIRKDNRAVQRLRHEVEKAKRVVSYQLQARIELDFLYGGYDFSETLTRAKFEELNMVSTD